MEHIVQGLLALHQRCIESSMDESIKNDVRMNPCLIHETVIPPSGNLSACFSFMETSSSPLVFYLHVMYSRTLPNLYKPDIHQIQQLI